MKNLEHVKFVKSWSVVVLLLVAATASGCGASAQTLAARDAKRQRKLAVEQCAATLEVYPPGMRPTRPFRVLGPVEGEWGFTAGSRFERMRKNACELGAQAIIDASEHYQEVAGTRTTTLGQDALGRPVAVVEEPRSSVRRTTALAIAYTDTPIAPQIIVVTTPPAR
jgi:hypothetical protein